MPAQALEITVERLDDFSRLAPLWLDLEARSDGSFFQSWAWTGCLAQERFAEPWLLSARRGARIVALGLFNRGLRPPLRISRPVLLGESGDADQDSLFIEHNGLLIDRDESSALAARCWAALDQSPLRRSSWVLSGVPETVAATLPPHRRLKVVVRRPAPYLDFSKLGDPTVPVLDHLSANSRQQLRRSFRQWEAIGDLSLQTAQSGDEANAYFDELRILHQRYWTGRGQRGAFAVPFFERFHRALMSRPTAGQGVDLVRVKAGTRVFGYLYNLIHDGWVASYQSGFDFGADADRLRPGLICHALAIDHYRRSGMRLYDFLGGDARYKRSLANAARSLLWLKSRPN